MRTASTACSTASTISGSPWSSRTRSNASSRSRRPRAHGREQTSALGHQLQHLGPSLDAFGLQSPLLDRLRDRARAPAHAAIQPSAPPPPPLPATPPLTPPHITPPT